MINIWWLLPKRQSKMRSQFNFVDSANMARSLIAKELIVKCGYGNIAYKLWGENISTTDKFISVHGWLDNAGSFDPLMEHFITEGNLVVYLL